MATLTFLLLLSSLDTDQSPDDAGLNDQGTASHLIPPYVNYVQFTEIGHPYTAVRA